MLRVDNLSVTYKSTGKKVLDRINLDIKKGEVVAILDPSGCGKTTLLNVIAGLVGEKQAEIEGQVFARSEKIGIVFQEPRLLPWRSVLGNVAYSVEAGGGSKEAARKKAKNILKKVQLADFVDYYPSQLSLGMKQRVNFARALVTAPKILLMDEPFSSLDSGTKQKIISEIKVILKKNKMTTFFVTHSDWEAKNLADRVITLHGRPSRVLSVSKTSLWKKGDVLGSLEYEY